MSMTLIRKGLFGTHDMVTCFARIIGYSARRQALCMNAPRFASNCAIWGGLCSVFESSMIYVRQKDDPWNNILSTAAASGFLKMRQGLGQASCSALFFGIAVALFECREILDNRATSNVQSKLDKK